MSAPVTIVAGGSLDGLPNPQPADMLSGVAGPITTTADTLLIAAQGAGTYVNVTTVHVQNEHASVNTRIEIKSATTVVWRGYAPAAGGGFVVRFPDKNPLRMATNAALNVACVTTGATVIASASGFKSTF